MSFNLNENTLKPELADAELRQICRRLIVEPARILSAKIIPPGAAINRGGIQRSVQNANISFGLINPIAEHFEHTQVISMPTSPFPLLLEQVPPEIEHVVANLETFYHFILPSLVNQFPFLLDLLGISPADFCGQEFAQRYDAVVDTDGRMVIIDENTVEGGMSIVGPRADLLTESLGIEHQAFDMSLMAEALANKFDALAEQTGIVPEGPIIYLTSESPLSMSTPRRYEVIRLGEHLPIQHLSAHDILNSESPIIKDGFIYFKGVRSNRVVNLLRSGGFVTDMGAKNVIADFIEKLNADQSLLVLNRVHESGTTLSAHKLELALLRLPTIQAFIAQNFPNFDLLATLNSIAVRKLLFVDQKGKVIKLNFLADINETGPVLREAFAGSTKRFCRSSRELPFGNVFIKDALGTATRGLFRIHSQEAFKDGDAGMFIGFCKERGVATPFGKAFVVEDFIPNQTFSLPNPLGLLHGKHQVQGHSARFEIYHTQGQVIGLSATMSDNEVVHGGGGSFVQPILIKDFNHE